MGEREELIESIRGRVERMATSGDPAAILAPAAGVEAQRLVGYTTDGPPDVEAFHALGWLYYQRALVLPPDPAARERDVAVSCLRACFLAGAEDLPAPLLPVLAKGALDDASAVLAHAAGPAGTPADFTYVVSLYRRIADNIPGDDPDHVQGLIGLIVALKHRYKRTGQVTDAYQAVEVGRAAVRITGDGHPHRQPSLIGLAEALLELSWHTDDPGHLDEAVEAGRATLRTYAVNDPTRAGILTNLSLVLRRRFKRMGRLADLDEAIETSRAAVRDHPHGDPKRASGLSNLGLALQARFNRTGGLADLDEAVETGRAAVRAAPYNAALLTALSYALKLRFERTGDRRDLDEAVAASRAALQATPQDDPAFASRMVGLGNLLRLRFEYGGRLEDLDEAVDACRAGAQATHRDNSDRAGNLANLGTTLRVRFRHTGDLADLDEAVDACRAAVDAIPHDHADHAGPLLYELSLVLRMRFERTSVLRDVDEAVEVARAAVRATPDDHPNRVRHLSALGNALVVRFRHSGELADVDEAVDTSRTIVRAMPPGHVDYGTQLTNLGVNLQSRFERTGNRGDLNEAVDACRAALRAVPDGHPDHGVCLVNLSSALRARFASAGDPRDREEAVTMCERTVNVSSTRPLIRIRAAHAAGRLAASSDPARAAELLERAVLMLPEAAPRRLRRSDQEHALGSHAGLAADATALALAGGDGDTQQRAVRALRLAEAARAVLLSQALDVRSDLTDLHDRHPQLAERFSELRELLDHDHAPETAENGADQGEQVSHDRHRLATELEEVLERIRACEGFADFGRPPTLEHLLAEASDGPVVTFNVSNHRSDALLLTRHGISSCPLPGLTEDLVVDRINTFYQALTETTAPDSDRIAAQQALRRILEWLWESAAEPALDALAALGEAIPPDQDGQPLPRVWWAPGGLLGLLPLHAAGFHTDPGHGPHHRTVMDRVISSYTPTIRALRHARRRRPTPTDQLQSLIVAMPTTPGHSPLPHVPAEVRRVRAFLHNPVQLTEPDGTPSLPDVGTVTTAAVLALLPQCAVAHFACHGASNRLDPSQSCLLLHDHATTPLTVSALAHINLNQAQLAYLSACSTANPGGSGLRDEAIHLTSAFQLAGFPHVIGTLWPIDDRLAVDIAESFYTHLTNGQPETFTPTRAATALHHTIRAVRDRYPATPSLWAGYLHAGA